MTMQAQGTASWRGSKPRAGGAPPLSFSAPCMESIPERQERPDPCGHRSGQNLGGMDGSCDGMDGRPKGSSWRCGSWEKPGCQERRRRAGQGALDHPSQSPCRGYHGSACSADSRTQAPLDGGTPHGRHPFIPEAQTNKKTAHGPDHHPREPVAVAFLSRGPREVRDAAIGCGRRVA
jgi:hypothetical protein